MTFWEPQMERLLEQARSLPGFHEGMAPYQFAEWLNQTLNTKVPTNINPELAAIQWLKALEEKHDLEKRPIR